MPYVIGAGTFVTGFGSGIQSISLSLTPQINRLWELGSTVPYDKDIRKQKTLNITKYSGATQANYSILASSDCTEATPLDLIISASNCNGGVFLDSDSWWITSYSYSKDIQGWGIESYSLINRPEIIGSTGVICRMIRGTAEGQRTSNGGADTGIQFLVGTTQVDGQTIEVTAGSPSIGKTFDIEYGEVASVGGGLGKGDGKEGNGQVSVPYVPIYFAT